MEKFPEKKSGVNRVVGIDNSELESKILDYFSTKFKELPDNEAKEIEYQKTPEVRELIDETIEYMGKFLQQYGVEAVKISADKIFIFDQSKLGDDFRESMQKKFGSDAGAIYLPASQRIFVLKDIDTLSSAQLSSTVAHELVHLNSFTSYQPTKDGADASISIKFDGSEINLKQRRLGLDIKSRSGEKYFFTYLNEAVTEELASRFCNQFFSKINQLKNVSEEKNTLIEKKFPQDKRGRAMTDILETITTQQSSGQWKTILVQHSYPEERRQLNKIIDELWEGNKDKFSSREDIFNLFVDAVFKGRLLPLARLIEKSYSKGMFRFIAESSEKKEPENKGGKEK